MTHPHTISAIHAAYANGASPLDLADRIHADIAAAGDPGIFLSMCDRDATRAAIDRLGQFDPQKKPLWGIPFAIKDNIDLAGQPTTAGCRQFSYHPETSAAAVSRLIEAGAIPIGKTNLDQFATGLVGVRTPYPVPRNACDPTLVPGGSSSGSAVAVARGLVPFALGTDTAGSGRVPAALNNIVGLKPSLGAVSTRGVVPACRSLDSISVFALTVGDAWRVFDVMTAFDAADPYSRPIGPMRPGRPPSVRIGVPDSRSLTFYNDPQARKAFEKAIEDAASLGAQIVDINLQPFRAVADLLYDGPWVAERYHAIRDLLQSEPQAVHPVTRKVISGAEALSAVATFDGFYRLAELRRQTETAWSSIDALMVPSIPTLYTLDDVAADPIGANARLGTYTNFVNLLDLCAIAVPGRLRADRRPSGLTLIAPRGRDGFLAALGDEMHARAGVPLGAGLQNGFEPLTGVTAAPTGWHEIAVVGAHMSGLPLNRELTDQSAIFLRRARTQPDYRLFALAGGPPKRPGLLRVASAEGSTIEVEVWALPADAFGRFVASIPSPLGIATLLLDDGTQPKGFVVEPQGVIEALDISNHGGWRTYLDAGD